MHRKSFTKTHLFWQPPNNHHVSTRIARGANGAMPPKISTISCHFALWEAVSQTKYCCSLKLKRFSLPQNFGRAKPLHVGLWLSLFHWSVAPYLDAQNPWPLPFNKNLDFFLKHIYVMLFYSPRTTHQVIVLHTYPSKDVCLWFPNKALMVPGWDTTILANRLNSDGYPHNISVLRHYTL